MNMLKASAILQLAPSMLYKDGSYKSATGCTRYSCHAVQHAAAELLKSTFGDMEDDELVNKIQLRIRRYMQKSEVMEEYARDYLGIDYNDDKAVYNLRVKMLEELLAEYEKKEALEEQIRILEAVKELRQTGAAIHNFVCWNINQVMGDEETAETKAITSDIHKYIDGEVSVRAWVSAKLGRFATSYEEVVLNARMEMIDTLIARYKEELEAA